MFQITLAAARVNAHLKQDEAASKIGITAKTLRNYEQGKTAIPGHILRTAAQLYGIPEDMIKLPLVDDGKFDDDEFFLQPTTV